MAAHPLKHRRTLNVFVLAMLSLAVVVSLRNLPLTAEYGLGSIFFYCISALCFMVPYALVSAELASGWPKAGGIYVWVREALGERWGFLAIWMQWFHNMTWYPAMLAFIAASFAQFIDPALASNKIYIIAVVLIGFWGVTLLNFLGIKTSALVSTVCVVIGAILPGIILIGMAIYWISTGGALAIPFRAADLIPDLSHPSNLVFLAGIFLALSGLEANANLAREVKNPQKNYPRAILIAATLTLGILILGSLAIAVVIPREQISLVSGLLDTFHFFFDAYNLSWVVPLIALLTAAGALGELNAWAIAGAKGLFVTTEHGCLPPLFHKVNKHYTPINLMIFQAIVVSIAAFIFLYMPNINTSYWLLSALSAQMYLVMYLLLFIAGIVLRYTRPHVHRAYRVPLKNVGMWIICIVGIGSALFALTISFLPPLSVFTADLTRYETLIFVGFAVNLAVPLTLYALRKPHWQLEVLEEIREEIHKSTH
ncbi:MAG: Glutamate/gamma-aminobutyrate antiporter [Chlamydiales bacterium]|nr:Glutamate/gamma-aminobutyrate antiporter [Chlamydiales bacterium]